MSNRFALVLTVIGVSAALIFSGCGQSADLSLKFSSDDSASFKSTNELTKLFRFEQPNIGKLKEEQTKNLFEMTFNQKIQSVDADGTAAALITIEALKVEIIKKNEAELAFDSTSEADANAPLAKLIGKSYTITISPNGQAKLANAAEALKAVTAAYEKKIVASLLNEKTVAERHQVTALPKDASGPMTVNNSWDEVVASPPGLLAPKSYKKTYTLTAVDGNTATVQMVATEAAAPAATATQSSAGMGMFAKMFDNTDDFTGSLKFDAVTGSVISLDETLTSTYTAQEMPANGDPEKGPDVLTMQLIQRIGLEKLN